MNNEKKSKSLSDLLSTTIYTSAAVFALIFIWKRTLYKPSTLNWNGWAFYEWLINYEGGFVRRGLIGSLINTYYFNSEIIAINTLVFWGAFIFIVLTTLFVSNKIKSIKSTLLFTFCPIGFYWMAIGNEYYYRKEIIFLIAILCSCLAFLNWKKTASRLVPPLLTAFIFLISGLLLLIHESFIFYGCLIFSLILFEFHQNNSIIRKKVILAYILLCLIIFGILSIYKGDENTSLAIWNSLSNSVKTLREYSSPAGGISAIGWSLVKGLSLSLSAILSGMVTYYIFPILIIYLYLGFIIADYRNYKLKNIYFSKNFSIPFLTIIISFSPLSFGSPAKRINFVVKNTLLTIG